MSRALFAAGEGARWCLGRRGEASGSREKAVAFCPYIGVSAPAPVAWLHGAVIRRTCDFTEHLPCPILAPTSLEKFLLLPHLDGKQAPKSPADGGRGREVTPCPGSSFPLMRIAAFLSSPITDQVIGSQENSHFPHFPKLTGNRPLPNQQRKVGFGGLKAGIFCL